MNTSQLLSKQSLLGHGKREKEEKILSVLEKKAMEKQSEVKQPL